MEGFLAFAEDAPVGEGGLRKLHFEIGDLLPVDGHAAALHELARFAVRARKAALDHQGQHADASPRVPFT